MNSPSSSTLKSRENAKLQDQTNIETNICTRKNLADVTDSTFEDRVAESIHQQEELIQSLSTCSGITAPMASRFVRQFVGSVLHVIPFLTFDVLALQHWS